MSPNPNGVGIVTPNFGADARPYQYGDQNVRRILVTNDSIYDLVSLGDSTQASNFGACANFVTSVNWLGGTLYPNTPVVNAHYPGIMTVQCAGNSQLAPPNLYTDTVASIFGGNVNDYCGLLSPAECKVLGSGIQFGAFYPANTFYNRIEEIQPTSQAGLGANTPWFGWDDFLTKQIGKAIKTKCNLYAPAGQTLNSALMQQQIGQQTAATTVASAPISVSTAVNNWLALELTLPADHNVVNTFFTGLYGVNAVTTIPADIGKGFSYAYSDFQILGNGKKIHSWGIGGQCIEGYLNAALVPNYFWNESITHFISNPIFWIDLGTNNPFNDTTATFITKLKQLIALCRTKYPNAYVLLTTSHPTAGQGGITPYFVYGAIDVAKTTPGVLCIDTWSQAPTYPNAVILGYMADNTHYNQTGNQNWFSNILNKSLV